MTKTKEQKASENFVIFMERGPGLWRDYNTWIVAKDPTHEKHLIGGLGGLGVGEMWVDTEDADRMNPEYVDAPVQDYRGLDNDALQNAIRETDLLKKFREEDTTRVDWLEAASTERLENVRWRIENEGGTVREAIDWFRQRDAIRAKEPTRR